jgi:hypothetical protein
VLPAKILMIPAPVYTIPNPLFIRFCASEPA